MARLPVLLQTPRTIGDAGVPIKGASVVQFFLDFTGVAEYSANLHIYQASRAFGIPRSIYVNNKDNPNGITISIQETGSQEFVPGNTIGLLPITAPADCTIIFKSDGGATAQTMVDVELYNYERPPYTYAGLGQFAPGSQVEALVQQAATWTPRNALLGPGVAANIFPTVAKARQAIFKNIGGGAGNDVAWWQVGVTATGVFGSGDQPLEVGEQLILPYRTLQRISFFSTGGTQIAGHEWND